MRAAIHKTFRFFGLDVIRVPPPDKGMSSRFPRARDYVPDELSATKDSFCEGAGGRDATGFGA